MEKTEAMRKSRPMWKAAIWLLEKLLTLRGGDKLWEYWAWEETPYPVGSPSWKQVAFGYRMALFPTAWIGKSSSTKAEEEYFKKYRDEHERRSE